MEDKWISIDELTEIPREVNEIHCDTRDFHCLLSTENLMESKEKEDKPLKKIFKKYLEDESHPEVFITSSGIIDILKKLKEWSGGNQDWRMLSFKKDSSLSDFTGLWFKYIRFYRIKEDKFIISDRSGTAPFDWKKLFKEENIERRYLGVEN